MGKLLDMFRGARRLELLILLALLAMLLALWLDAGQVQAGSDMNSDEQRMAGILSEIEGAGKVSVMIAEEGDMPEGVVVVASGAESIAVQLKMRNAVHALTGLALDRIEVYASS